MAARRSKLATSSKCAFVLIMQMFRDSTVFVTFNQKWHRIFVLNRHIRNWFGPTRFLKIILERISAHTIYMYRLGFTVSKLVRSLIAINSIGWRRRMRWTIDTAQICVLSHQMPFTEVNSLEILLHDQHFAKCVDMLFMWFIQFHILLLPFACLRWFRDKFTNARQLFLRYCLETAIT